MVCRSLCRSLKILFENWKYSHILNDITFQIINERKKVWKSLIETSNSGRVGNDLQLVQYGIFINIFIIWPLFNFHSFKFHGCRPKGFRETGQPSEHGSKFVTLEIVDQGKISKIPRLWDQLFMLKNSTVKFKSCTPSPFRDTGKPSTQSSKFVRLY